MNFLGRMYVLIKLKVTQNQGFTLSLEVIFRKTTEVGLTLIEYLEIHAKFSQQKKLDIKISGKSQKLQIK